MSEHNNAGGIAIHWLLFGSGGHETKPEGGVLENYTMCAEKDFRDNYYIKTICDPMKVLSYATAHNPLYRKGFYNLDEEGNIVEGLKAQEVHFEKVRINHYFSKSKEEYIEKKNRGVADSNNARTMEDFYIHDRNEVIDTEILTHI